MNNIDPEIFKRLDALAAKLGVTAERLWAVLVKQAGVELFVVLLSSLLLGAMAVVCFRLTGWFMRKAEDRGDGYGIAAVLSGIACLILVIVTIAFLCEAPTLVMNPEYWALREILKVAGR